MGWSVEPLGSVIHWLEPPECSSLELRGFSSSSVDEWLPVIILLEAGGKGCLGVVSQYVPDELLVSGCLNGMSFDGIIILCSFDHFFEYGLGQSFKEQMGYFCISLNIACFIAEVFKLGNVLVNFWHF